MTVKHNQHPEPTTLEHRVYDWYWRGEPRTVAVVLSRWPARFLFAPVPCAVCGCRNWERAADCGERCAGCGAPR